MHKLMKDFADVCAGCAALFGVFSALPTILSTVASALAIIWYIIRFREWYKSRSVSTPK